MAQIEAETKAEEEQAEPRSPEEIAAEDNAWMMIDFFSRCSLEEVYRFLINIDGMYSKEPIKIPDQRYLRITAGANRRACIGTEYGYYQQLLNGKSEEEVFKTINDYIENGSLPLPATKQQSNGYSNGHSA